MRIAVPILVVFAVVFLGIMGYFLRIGFGTTGSAFGPGVAAAPGTVREQGDARIQATPAPIATSPPGTFTVPQTGSGPISGGQSNQLPGAQTGGGTPAGPPAPVMAQIQELRGRLERNPKDLAALVGLGNMEFDARKFDKADGYYRRALALDPSSPDVRTDDAVALHQSGHDIEALAQLDRVLAERPKFPNAVFNRGVVLQAIGRRSDALETFRKFLTVVPAGDPRAADAKAAIAQLGG
jgi:hypothetical protein